MKANFLAKLTIVIYFFLQLFHWQLYPLFMDIYYHLHTAWGFIQSGGYSAWDFWEYAPLGRTHVYPPAFHLILACLMKIGVDKIIIAKVFEIIFPILLMSALWYFLKKHFTERLGLFVLIAFGSSFSFFLSLINHLPVCLALIFGTISLGQLFKRRFLRCAVLLSLCLYTHIGISYYFILAFAIFAVMEKTYRKLILKVILIAVVLSLPMLIKESLDLKFINLLDLKENFFCEFKSLDYILAFAGILLAFKYGAKYKIFPSLFLSSFIFIKYPYRFFSAEGYLPIALLSGLTLDYLYSAGTKDKKPIFAFLLGTALLALVIISPTFLLERKGDSGKLGLKTYNFDSTLVNLAFPQRNTRFSSQTLWLPNEYIPTAILIRQHSQGDDIIYCRLANVAVTLAILAQRASANGLLPESAPPQRPDPFLVSKIIIEPRSEDVSELNHLISRYRLRKIGENKLFIILDNPYAAAKAKVSKPVLSFWQIALILLATAFLFICCCLQ